MATSSKDAADTGNNTVIGPSILISGKLTGDEDLTVRGRVEGELSLSRTLIVETSGVVKANVSVKNAIVSGVVVGNITATESVELTREGRMVGDIRSPRVIIVDGASFRGRVDMGELEAGRTVDRTSRPLIRPAQVQTRATSAPVPPPSRVQVQAPVSRPPAPPPRLESRSSAPVPPPVSSSSGRINLASLAGRPPAPPPRPPFTVQAPVPPTVGVGAKKKVFLKKKGR